MLTTSNTSPEVRTLRELESILRDKQLTLTRARVDPDGIMRVQVTSIQTARSHHGSSRDLAGAVTAALQAESSGVDAVTR